MEEEEGQQARLAADRVIRIEEEVEASGTASFDSDALEQARATLHAWIDAMIGVVVSPGLGRVTVIHGNGRQSSIASPDLPFAMSKPVGTKPDI